MKRKKLVYIKGVNKDQTLWLDSVNGDKFSIIWRGNKKTPNGFNKNSAIFDLCDIGQLLGKAHKEGHINKKQIHDFIDGLLDN